MKAAVATLQMAAQELHSAGAVEQAKYVRIVSQLRSIAEQLTSLDRRVGEQDPDPVDFAALLHDAATAASAAAGRDQCGVALHLAAGVMVEGPGGDLRTVVGGLAEYALTVGCDAIELRTDGKAKGARHTCITEFVVRSRDVPDFLRQDLWNAVRIRHGEVSVICEPDKSRIRFSLPIERRQTAASC